MNIIPLNIDDNVGDGLAKLNYNFLSLNSQNCDIQNQKKENDDFLNDFEDLLLKLDDLIDDINYDFLEKMESTVQILSSYWNNFEFTVNYPFNSTNGFTGSLVAAGEFGNLRSSTNPKTQETILATALVENKYYENRFDAIDSFKNNELIYVIRDSDGKFISWNILDYSLILSFSVDIEGNFYFNGNLVDIYKIDYYSALAPNSFSIASKKQSINFKDKTFSSGNKLIVTDKNSLVNTNIVTYSVKTEQEVSQTENILDVTRFKPTIKKLTEIIPSNSSEFKFKIKQINDTFLESYLSNPKLNNLSISFLNRNYNASKYQDGTIVNVVFFLYNVVGYDTSSAKVVTNYWKEPEFTKELKDTQIIKTGDLKLVAPSSNTTFNIEFTKKDTYIEKIVTVKYIKKTKTSFVQRPNSSIPRLKVEGYWEFVNASIGRPYQKGNTSVKNVDDAPKYVKTVPTAFQIKQFPTTILTKTGDILTTKKGDTYLLG
jgi:hypothetical protein